MTKSPRCIHQSHINHQKKNPTHESEVFRTNGYFFNYNLRMLGQ